MYDVVKLQLSVWVAHARVQLEAGLSATVLLRRPLQARCSSGRFISSDSMEQTNSVSVCSTPAVEVAVLLSVLLDRVMIVSVAPVLTADSRIPPSVAKYHDRVL